MYHNQRENLKMKIKSVTKLKLRKAREEYELRNKERILSEELRSTQLETEIMSQQLEGLKQEVAKMKCQIAMIGICEASEKSKIDNHISNIKHHQNGFDELFSREREAIERNKLEAKKKEEEEKELEQQKGKLIDEKNQLIQQEAKTIEEECEAMEKECAVLKKRNKAIMLKLRRKLIESEDKRRALMKKEETPVLKRHDSQACRT